MANPRTIGQLLAEIATLYPLMFNVTPEMSAVWSMYLRDIDDELLVNALRHYVATSKDNYPPSVPALRLAASALRRLAAGVPTAFEAWENLTQVGERSRVTNEYTPEGLQIIERYRVEFRHPLVEKVARQLGWPRSFPDAANLMADRAHFLKAYDSAVDQAAGADRELPEVLAYIERVSTQPALPGIGDLVKKLEASHD